MPSHHTRRMLVGVLGAIAVLGATALALSTAVGTDAAPPSAVASAAKKVTARGVGAVRLGKTYRQLRRQRLVRRIRSGCPLGGPRTRSARLRRPLRGSVDFTLRRPRRVANIAIRGGAKARGVGIGDTIADIRGAYRRVRVNHGTDDTFGITLVRVPRRAGGRISFAVGVRTKRITLIGVPRIPFCE